MLNSHGIGRALLALGAAVMAATAAGAQQAPCYPIDKPGREIRQFSRNIKGQVKAGQSVLNPKAGSVVFLYNCQPTTGAEPDKSRQVFYGQLTIDFSEGADCDELKGFTGVLRGDYHSLMRLNDPFPSALPDAKIGRHDAHGYVFDPTGAKIGTFAMLGTISTNPSRPPIEPTGTCYQCLRHEGVIVIRLQQSPVFVSAPAYITASYEWISDPLGYNCEDADPCLFDFALTGTMDGIAEADCGTIHL